MTSINRKARIANSRSRACVKCKFHLTAQLGICEVCNKAFIEGYTKGYSQAKKDNKQ